MCVEGAIMSSKFSISVHFIEKVSVHFIENLITIPKFSTLIPVKKCVDYKFFEFQVDPCNCFFKKVFYSFILGTTLVASSLAQFTVSNEEWPVPQSASY